MPLERTRSLYRRTLKETVYVRRYTGAGPNRPQFDWATHAALRGFMPEELVGGIVQGDRKAVVGAEELVAGGFPFPVTTNDRLIVRGKELAIIASDDNSRRDEGVLVALELHVRG